MFRQFSVGGEVFRYVSLKELEREGYDVDRLPYSVRILLENVVRNLDNRDVTSALELLANWNPKAPRGEIAIKISRVIMQDYTGVPAVVDLATMRQIVANAGGDPAVVNPKIPVALVIDHSVHVDFWGSREALWKNMEMEISRNRERYRFLKWAQGAFKNLTVFPPGVGIIHQINLERLTEVVATEGDLAYFETVVGMDSHTTMVNGLGVLGWGVGGVEAEAVMLGEPITIPTPRVVGVYLYGKLKPGVTATDVALAVAEVLRKVNVVDAFVEFFGEGVRELSAPDRATIANMAPEYGSTTALFPVDENTLKYLRATGRPPSRVALVEAYYKLQGVFGGVESAEYSEVVEIDLSTVDHAVAGPTLPWQRRRLGEVAKSFADFLNERKKRQRKVVEIEIDGVRVSFGDGDVVIAAVTSCTNTSNPYLLAAAGLLAKRAVELGLKPPPYVKTSFTPGSRAAAEMLEKSGLQKYLDQLGFHVVAFGCATCIGNSGPLPQPVAKAVREQDILATAVLSGNRNFEGRIHPDVRAAYITSPPLVVAYAIAGTVYKNLESEPLAFRPDGSPVYLADLWPSQREVEAVVEEWGELEGREWRNPLWDELEAPTGLLYPWDPNDTYIQPSPLFTNGGDVGDIVNARPLLVLGDNITTDHISPAGGIPVDSPAGRYLTSLGVKPHEFNTFGARRGNWQVMVRGTFGSRGYRNKAGNLEGGYAVKQPEGIVATVYEVAEMYKREGVPVVVVAGKNYGAGSSRDWAAKGPKLLGVRAVIAESFERIHRTNLAMVGIIPIQTPTPLELKGDETIDILGLSGGLKPGGEVFLRIKRRDGTVEEVKGRLAVHTWAEVEYIRHGGVLPYVLKKVLKHD